MSLSSRSIYPCLLMIGYFGLGCGDFLSEGNNQDRTIREAKTDTTDDTENDKSKKTKEPTPPAPPKPPNPPTPPNPPAPPIDPNGVGPQPYQANVIFPSNQQQQQADDLLKGFYQAWKSKHIQQNALCGADTYYVDTTGDVAGSDTLTVSEAIGFGMVIMPQMAAFDPDAQKIFDGLLKFYQNHPSSKEQRLMNWQIKKDCTSTPNSTAAPDGDMDAAYGLLLAAKIWPTSKIDYKAQANRILQGLIESKIVTDSNFIALWEGANDDNMFQGVTRSSDYIGHYFDAFGQASGNARWGSVKERGHSIINTIQTNHSPQYGLVSDFVRSADGTASRPTGKVLEKNEDKEYFYNACRVPWRLALGGILDGDKQSVMLTNRISRGLQTLANGQCNQLKNGYSLEGQSLGNDVDMAFVGPAAVGAMLDGNQQGWLDNLWQCMINKPFDQGRYYGNTIKLMSLIVLTKHWQTPN